MNSAAALPNRLTANSPSPSAPNDPPEKTAVAGPPTLAADSDGRNPVRHSARPRAYRVVSIIAVLISIAVVVSIAVIDHPSPSPSKLAGQVDFATARQRSNSTLVAYGGGPWTLFSVLAVNDPSSIELPNAYATAVLEVPPLRCNQTLLGLGPNVTVPSSSWSVGNGSAAFWQLSYRNVSAGVIVDVLEGVATPAVSLSGVDCGASLAALPAIPTGAGPSQAVARALDPYDSAFFTQFPNVPGVLAAETAQPLGYSYPMWIVEDDACPTAHASFFAELNISTDLPLIVSTEVGDCGFFSSGAEQLEQSLSFDDGPWLVSNGTEGAVYVWNVTGASNSTTWADVLPEAIEPVPGSSSPAENATRGSIPVTSGWNLTARSPSNRTIASFDPVDWTWSGDASELIQENDSIQVVLTGQTADNPDLILELGGAGTFSGFFELPL